MPEFDPSKPFEPIGATAAAPMAFDPSKPHEVLSVHPQQKGGFWRNAGAGLEESPGMMADTFQSHGTADMSAGANDPQLAPRDVDVATPITKAISGVTGLDPSKVPQNTFVDRLGRNLGRSLPTMIAPEAGAANAARVAATGLGSVLGQTAAQEFFPDSPTAQTIGALIGGGGTGAVVSGRAGRAAGTVAANTVGTTTGVGATPLKTAFRAGAEGNKTFLQHMREGADPAAVVKMAKDAVTALRQDRSKAYQAGMGDIRNQSEADSAAYRAQMAARAEDTGIPAPRAPEKGAADPSQLSFDPIYEKISETNKVKNFQGEDLDPKTAAAREEVSNIISDWRNKDPETFHTPMGFDALKQKLGYELKTLDYKDPAYIPVKQAYDAVKEAIVKQAPTYAKVMKNYETASDLITEMEKTLSLNPKATIDTQLRKLQSVMRNDVSTSYGARAKLVDEIAKKEPDVPFALAGQALNPIAPRGIARAGVTMGAVAKGLASLPALPFASPRAMGELSYGLGKVFGRKNPIPPAPYPYRGLIPAALPTITPTGVQSPYRKGGFVQ